MYVFIGFFIFNGTISIFFMFHAVYCKVGGLGESMQPYFGNQ